MKKTKLKQYEKGAANYTFQGQHQNRLLCYTFCFVHFLLKQIARKRFHRNNRVLRSYNVHLNLLQRVKITWSLLGNEQQEKLHWTHSVVFVILSLSKDTVYLCSRLLFCSIHGLQSLVSGFFHRAQCSVRPGAVHLLSLTRLL